MCSLQVTRKSTATLFVEGFKSVLYPPRRASDHTDHAPHRTCNPHDMGEGGQGEAGFVRRARSVLNWGKEPRPVGGLAFASHRL